METLLLGLGVTAALVGWLIHLYNSLIAQKNAVKQVFASIDSLLTQRYDVLPNLVATVQAYAKHEQDTLVRLTEMRAKASAGGLTQAEKMKLDTSTSQMVTQLLATAENYPELKANQNFMHLQHTLTELEDQLAAARRAYSGSVTAYNNALEMFPSSLMAGMMNLQPETVYKAEAVASQRPDLDMLFNAKTSQA